MKVRWLILIFLLYSVIFINGERNVFSRSGEDEEIMKSYHFYKLYAAFAFRRRNKSICDNSPSSHHCYQEVEFFERMKNIAEGNCTRLNSKFFQELCRIVKNNCRGSDNSYIEGMCNAFKEKDITKIMMYSNTPAWLAEITSPMDKEEAQFTCFIFYSFIDKKVDECLRYMKEIESSERGIYQGICRILFAPRFSSSDFHDLIKQTLRYYKERHY